MPRVEFEPREHLYAILVWPTCNLELDDRWRDRCVA